MLMWNYHNTVSFLATASHQDNIWLESVSLGLLKKYIKAEIQTTPLTLCLSETVQPKGSWPHFTDGDTLGQEGAVSC